MDNASLSLAEILELKFHGVERELASLHVAVENFRIALERLALEMVTHQQLGRIITEVDASRDKIDELEKRVARHDADMRVIKWIGGAVVGIVLYLIGAYLKGLLGV